MKTIKVIKVRMLLKIIFVFSIAATALLLFTCSSNFAPKAETDMLPDIWRIKQAKDGARCVNITGDYQLWGEAAPHSPETYRGVSLSLYAIAGGPYVPDSDLKKITYVGIEHQDDSVITFIFFTSDGILTQQRFYPSEKFTAVRVII